MISCADDQGEVEPATGPGRKTRTVNREPGVEHANGELPPPRDYLQAVVERSSDASLVVGPDGSILFATPSVSRFGYTPSVLVGRNIRELAHPGDLEEALTTLEARLLLTGTATVEWRILTGDGEWCWVEEAITDLTADPTVAGLVVNVRDITSRRQGEEDLRVSGERLRRLFDGAPVGTAVVGLDGQVVEANQALLELLGYRADELVGRHFADITHPDDLAADSLLFARLFTGEIDHYRLDKRYLRKDGSEIVGRLTVSLVPDDQGRPGYAIGVVEDVTGMVRGQQLLAANEERLRMALDAARMATWEVEIATGQMTVSDNFDDVLGLPAGAFDGTADGFLSFIHPDDLALFTEQVLTPDGHQEFAIDHRLLSPLRGARWMHGRGRFVRDPGGGILRIVGVIMDVTAHRMGEHRRFESERVFRHTVEATTDAFLGVRSDGTVTSWNRSAEVIFGWTAGEAIGRHFAFVIPPELRPAYRERLGLRAGQPDPANQAAGPIELTGLSRSGRRFPIEVSMVAVQREGDLGFNAFIRDITTRRVAEDQLARHAITDDATGLPNRALLRDRLDGALSRSAPESCLAVLFVDIDQLKVVNESLGHAAGDEALLAVAGRIAAVLRPQDTLARFSGDEFVVVAEHLPSVHQVTELAQAVVDAVARPLGLLGHELLPGVSVGVALGTAGSTSDGLLRDADLARFRAKARGRSRFELFDVAMRDEALARLHLERELRVAADDGQLRVHYQPVLTAWGRLVSVEALVRWEHPDRGLLPPNDFIPLAEETGLIVGLGTWVLREACRQAAVWRGTAPGLTVAVNLSTRQLLEPGLAGLVAGILTGAGLPPGALCLELTESALIEDEVRTLECLDELRALGVQIALDDFGTGYSSLLYLRQFPVQILKLDRSFVGGLAENAQDAAIVGSTIELAHALGLQAVAEGVETAQQLEALRRLDCDLMQGYLFSRPLPPGEFEEVFLGSIGVGAGYSSRTARWAAT